MGFAPLRKKFQFQTGSIKRTLSESMDATKEGFNSKLVRLKVSESLPNSSTKNCFNSKLVRLKVWQELREHEWLWEFQFQTGAIKRCVNLQMK